LTLAFPGLTLARFTFIRKLRNQFTQPPAAHCLVPEL
jgi:hypothetical protein